MGMGRPRWGRKRRERINISIDTDFADEVDEYAEYRGLSVSRVYEEGARLLLSKTKKVDRYRAFKKEVEELAGKKLEKRMELFDITEKIKKVVE